MKTNLFSNTFAEGMGVLKKSIVVRLFMTGVNASLVRCFHSLTYGTTVFLGGIGWVLFFLVSCGPEPDTFSVDFSWRSPVVDGSANFAASVSGFNGNFDHIIWEWNFGDDAKPQDGYTETVQHPLYTFSTYGTFTVRLTATGVDANGNTVRATRTHTVNVRAFKNVPSARIDSLTPNFFGVTVFTTTLRGEKYEYTDADPTYELQVALDPSFRNLIRPLQKDNSLPILDSNSYRLFPGASGKDIFQYLEPATTYYMRIKTTRYSSFKEGVVEKVSISSTPIIQFSTKPLPEVKIDVDTTTNAALVFLKVSLPGVSNFTKTLTVYKDKSTTRVGLNQIEVFPGADSSIYYRSPGSTLTFQYTLSYDHPFKPSEQIYRTGSVDIYTPNTLFVINDSTIASEEIFVIPKRLPSNRNLARPINFQGLGISIIWNNAANDDGTRLTENDDGTKLFRTDGIFFGTAFKNNWSHFVFAVSGVSYYHNPNPNSIFGNMVIYAEDVDYIYARMIQPTTQTTAGATHRTGFKMEEGLSTGGVRTFKDYYLKGFVFKLRKKFQ